MSTRERYERPAVLQALEGIGLVVALSAAVWLVAAGLALVVAWVF
ncbi:MAG: hypothetical protein R3249_00595 [Nitriliruptorales bacterium]|nr:hypothetical protein [Nitriliruptorales bacterium]